ncbi:heme NO-binding domain-containing protein [Jannaschia donghaensis]|uniref:Heme NO binding protein n=1 Tax=Jannaschia donghaensis TaxID=420998 RepID=A0A0M6YKI1_9RHOB|nr:heme NO-binding domain-containing protein [Jannaschia donghaensis]CTQ50319.1 Heme NO binding protein [Jannaschia donghaensis]
MHGLICKSLEEFVRDQHGEAVWRQICLRSRAPSGGFEGLRSYDDALMEVVFATAFDELGQSRSGLLEDIGHWICTHPPLEPVRRLIRFSGTSFVDLIYSLEDIHDRARIALPGLGLPKFSMTEPTANTFRICSVWHMEGGGAVLTGILRAMADDYGALALIEPGQSDRKNGKWHEFVGVTIFDQAHQEPREFTLGQGV